jgi:hypothetical protein
MLIIFVGFAPEAGERKGTTPPAPPIQSWGEGQDNSNGVQSAFC